jgi:hypothetical protein
MSLEEEAVERRLRIASFAAPGLVEPTEPGYFFVRIIARNSS